MHKVFHHDLVMVYQSYNPINGKWTLKALKNYIQQKSLTNYKAIALI